MRAHRPLVVALAFCMAGCASSVGPTTGVGQPSQQPHGDRGFVGQAAEVAAAWPGSAAERAWHTGYIPMKDPTVLPGDAFHNSNDKIAFGAGRFTVRVALPSAPAQETVRWDSGGTLALPSIGPLEALKQAGGGMLCQSADCGGVTVTVVSAAPTTLRVPTSRGVATVPGWSFHLGGYRDPVLVAAVGSTGPRPRGTVPAPKGLSETVAAAVLQSVSADGRTLVLGVAHGACDAGVNGEVYESASAVVVGGRVVPKKLKADEACPAMMQITPVTVRLSAPLGARTVLNVVDGAPELPGVGQWYPGPGR